MTVPNRIESPFEASVHSALSALCTVLSDDQLLVLAKELGIQRYQIKAIADRTMPVTTTTLIRIAVYLNFLGRPTGLEKCDKLVREFAVIFATGRDQIADLLPNTTNRDALLKYVRGQRALPNQAYTDIAGVVSNKAAELTVANTTAEKLRESIGGISPSALDLPLPRAEMQHLVHELSSESFRVHMLELLSLAKAFTQPEIPEDVRDALRNAVGQRNIFDLKNLLVRLCGSTAFKQP